LARGVAVGSWQLAQMERNRGEWSLRHTKWKWKFLCNMLIFLAAPWIWIFRSCCCCCCVDYERFFIILDLWKGPWRKRGIQRSFESLLLSSECFFFVFFLSSNNRQRNFQRLCWICFYFKRVEKKEKNRILLLFIFSSVLFIHNWSCLCSN